MDEVWRRKEPLPGLGEEGGRKQPREGCSDAVGVYSAWHWVAILLSSLDHLLGEGSSWYNRQQTETRYQVLVISRGVLQRQV